MSQALEATLSIYVLVFCRVGAVFVLLPGFASARMPASVRLLLAMMITVTLTPIVMGQSVVEPREFATLHWAMLTELLIGLAFGFWCYCFLYASRFAASVIASVVGLAGIPGQPLEDNDPSSHLATLLSLAATIMIFASDLHLASLAALVRSYETMPIYTVPSGEWLAQGSIKLVSETSVIGLQIASPFIVFAVVVNLALGLCIKFTPQLQIYFASMGLTIFMSFLILHTLFPNLAQIPVQAYSAWLSESLQ
jgi:flagellar biosynthesis protein FliR